MLFHQNFQFQLCHQNNNANLNINFFKFIITFHLYNTFINIEIILICYL